MEPRMDPAKVSPMTGMAPPRDCRKVATKTREKISKMVL
jgi:hypothetical protein